MTTTPTLLVERKCRETGTTVELWRNLDTDGKYTIVCQEHAFTSSFDQRYGETGAEVFLSHPRSEGWCEVCSGNYDPTQDDFDNEEKQ